ncbi:MAG: hypothetical protein Q8N98_00645 [bacterium]|nr:hypothetical protein [bacterium]
MGKHKKTRKEKIIIGLKRKLIISEPQLRSASQQLTKSFSPSSKDISPTDFAKKLPDKEEKNSHCLIEPSFIFNGLKKIVFFTVLAIGLEIMLYWWLELGGERILAK